MPPEKKQRINPFADLRDGALSGPTTVTTSVEEELASYKSLRLSSAVSPLPFWQEHTLEPTRFCLLWRVVCSPCRPARHSRSAIFPLLDEQRKNDARSQLSASNVESMRIRANSSTRAAALRNRVLRFPLPVFFCCHCWCFCMCIMTYIDHYMQICCTK